MNGPTAARDADASPAPAPLVAMFRRMLGPEITPSEARVALAGAVGLTALAAVAAAVRAPGWGALQWILALGIAFDLGGGVTGNATRSAARWAHRPGQGRARALFYAGHVHPVALALAFGTPWPQAAALYAAMLAGAALVALAPRPVARPVALGAVALALAAASAVAWPAGLEWFAPVYLLKLVGAHAVPPEA